MPPILITYDYEPDESLKLLWSPEDLVQYVCLAEGEDDLEEEPDEDGRESLLRWYLKKDDTHAILTLCRGSEPEQLLVDLSFSVFVEVPEGLKELGFDEAFQVTGVIAPEREDNLTRRGLASSLYAVIARYRKVLIVSDTYQHIPGKALWKSMARNGGHELADLDVYCFDTRSGRFLPYSDVSPRAYDGTNIPDHEIWSGHAHQHVVLVANYDECEE